MVVRRHVHRPGPGGQGGQGLMARPAAPAFGTESEPPQPAAGIRRRRLNMGRGRGVNPAAPTRAERVGETHHPGVDLEKFDQPMVKPGWVARHCR